MPSIDFPFELPREAMLTVGDLPFPKVASGKVREIFDMGDALLMVATDRVSAFDVVMNEGLAGKGALLTQISLYWFEQANRIMAHHLVDNHSDRLDSLVVDFPDLKYRSMIVKKLKPLPIEAVVRG
jgi:phosphoribosylaminoimidazole-succinocarboxamide synthase